VNASSSNSKASALNGVHLEKAHPDLRIADPLVRARSIRSGRIPRGKRRSCQGAGNICPCQGPCTSYPIQVSIDLGDCDRAHDRHVKSAEKAVCWMRDGSALVLGCLIRRLLSRTDHHPEIRTLANLVGKGRENHHDCAAQEQAKRASAGIIPFPSNDFASSCWDWLATVSHSLDGLERC
jgi:hypothetical protein